MFYTESSHQPNNLKRSEAFSDNVAALQAAFDIAYPTQGDALGYYVPALRAEEIA